MLNKTVMEILVPGRQGVTMGAFEDIHHRRIVGSLAMFDRMIFKGHLSRLYVPGAINAFLWAQGFPMKEFSRYAQAMTEQLTENAKAVAAEAGRPYLYLEHLKTRHRTHTKEDMARSIAQRDGITEGVVCVLSVVEPCWSFQIRANHRTGRLEA